METQKSGNRIRLLLLDDHVLFRESLSRLLASEPDFDMAAEVGTAAEALEVLHREPIDIVLLDFDLGEDHGNHFIGEARKAGFAGRVLLVTAGMNASESSIALQMGASGIFLKHNSPATLAKAIRQVAAGEMWVDPRIIQMMADGVRQPAGPGFEKLLTDRERQVLQAIFEGMTNKEIAGQLGVSEGAIKATLQQLFQKTRVRTRSQLVRIALETSLATVRKP
jgi:DNA-binding NarL/FixJ family response regulator